jgi:hypothetical protein
VRKLLVVLAGVAISAPLLAQQGGQGGGRGCTLGPVNALGDPHLWCLPMGNNPFAR